MTTNTENNDSNNKDSLNAKSTPFEVLGMIAGTLLIAALFTFIIVCMYSGYKLQNECSTEAVAYLTETGEGTPYLRAPYHGGIVTEYTPVYMKYEYVVDDTVYFFMWSCDVKINSWAYPENLNIKYSEDNPSKIMVDMSPLYYDTQLLKDSWSYHTAIVGGKVNEHELP